MNNEGECTTSVPHRTPIFRHKKQRVMGIEGARETANSVNERSRGECKLFCVNP